VRFEFTIVNNNDTQKVKQSEQSNGLILNDLKDECPVRNFEINDLRLGINPERSTIKTIMIWIKNISKNNI
jgi:hypothetical protein